MKSVYQFIIKPLGERYSNEIDIDGKKLIINSSISDHKFINRIAEVVSIPLGFKTKIQKGDTVVVHHNLYSGAYASQLGVLTKHQYTDSTYVLTYDTEDGVPVCSSVKLSQLT
jgi:hypothetical protein